MPGFRYPIRSDWLFYLFVVSYAYTLSNMTFHLWFGEGINIFATYSDAVLPAQVVIDANKVYWSKSSFLFSTLLLLALNVDIRAASGLAAAFWSGSLILNFGPSATLIFVLLIGLALVGQQIRRGSVFAKKLPA